MDGQSLPLLSVCQHQLPPKMAQVNWQKYIPDKTGELCSNPQQEQESSSSLISSAIIRQSFHQLPHWNLLQLEAHNQCVLGIRWKCTVQCNLLVQLHLVQLQYKHNGKAMMGNGIGKLVLRWQSLRNQWTDSQGRVVPEWLHLPSPLQVMIIGLNSKMSSTKQGSRVIQNTCSTLCRSLPGSIREHIKTILPGCIRNMLHTLTENGRTTKKTRCQDNWNPQIASIALYIDEIKGVINGYNSRMLEALANCIHVVLAQINSLVHGPIMAQFKEQISPTRYEYAEHKNRFEDFKKKHRLLNDHPFGAFGTWQPVFELDQAFCVHIRVPVFGTPPKTSHERDQAIGTIEKTMIINGKGHAWQAKADCHTSEKDGKRREDMERHMNGTNVMVKFMVTAYQQMLDVYGVAISSSTVNPHGSGMRSVDWEARICKDTRLTPLKKAPEEQETILTNGVELDMNAATMANFGDGQHTMSQAQAGVPAFVSMENAQKVSAQCANSSQAVAMSRRNCLQDYACHHSQASFGEALCCFMAFDPFAIQLIKSQTVKMMWFLFVGQYIKTLRQLFGVLAQGARYQAMPQGYALRRAKDTHQMWAHLSDDWDFDDPDEGTRAQIRQSLANAAYNVGDLIITSDEPVTVNMSPLDKVYTSSNTNPVADGGERGPNYMKRDGSLTYATNGIKVAIGIVLAIDATGVHIKKHGVGMFLWQKTNALDAMEVAQQLRIMLPKVKDQVADEVFTTIPPSAAAGPAAGPSSPGPPPLLHQQQQEQHLQQARMHEVFPHPATSSPPTALSPAADESGGARWV